jgi:hypothetical protein
MAKGAGACGVRFLKLAPPDIGATAAMVTVL